LNLVTLKQVQKSSPARLLTSAEGSVGVSTAVKLCTRLVLMLLGTTHQHPR
jgi:hypothetical protein